METRTVDLLKAGINVITGVDRDLLKVTTIKKKFVEQMELMSYGDFCRVAKDDQLGFVGRVEDKHVIVRTTTGFMKVTARDWVEWRQNTAYFDDTKVNAQNFERVSNMARAEWRALPQLFVD